METTRYSPCFPSFSSLFLATTLRVYILACLVLFAFGSLGPSFRLLGWGSSLQFLVNFLTGCLPVFEADTWKETKQGDYSVNIRPKLLLATMFLSARCS